MRPNTDIKSTSIANHPGDQTSPFSTQKGVKIPQIPLPILPEVLDKWYEHTLVSVTFETEDSAMRKGIHPELSDAKIACACGNEIQTRSTSGSYMIDICNACHPFFTGKQKLIDAEGRVQRFKRKYGNR